MKVLVTGATGDIGSALCIRLLDSGYRLRALVRNSSDASFLKQKGAELWQGDITDKDSLTGVADNVQAVFHLAAVLWVPNPKVEIPKVNYYGTVNIAQECLDKGIKRFIFTSFPLVLGPHKNTLNELFPQFAPSPPNFYHALYKKKAEEYLLELEREEKLPVSILRLGTVYGPQMLLIRKIVPLIKKGVFAIAGNGDNLVQMVHIDDVLQGMILALEKEKAMGNIYNICDDKTVTMKEFIYAIADELNVRRPPKLPVYLMRAAAFLLTSRAKIFRKVPLTNQEIITMSISPFAADNSKAKEELGFLPKYPTIYEGLKTCF